jgi:hypothetical protein
MRAGIAIIAVSLLVAGAPALAQQSKTAAKPDPAKSAPAHSVAANNQAPKQTASHETPGQVTQSQATQSQITQSQATQGQVTQSQVTQGHGAAAPAALADIPDAKRLAIADLIWLGGFDGLSAEECDRHAADAIKAFQRRNGSKDTGVLSDQDRAALAQAAAAPEAAAGWRLIDDTATGAFLGVPVKIVPRASSTRTGSRWTSAQGQIQIETFRLHDASLPALFDQEKKAVQRYAAYSALSSDSFVITGEQKLKYFVERVQANGKEIRGVTISYDQATAGTIAPVAVAVSDSFDGFPEVTGSVPARQRGVQYGTAVVVGSSGDLVTTGEVTEDCQAISVPGFGYADRIAEDKTNDLALLRLYGARLLAAPLDGEDGTPGALTLYGVADPLAQAGAGAVSSTAAQLTGQGLDPAPKPGFSGAAAVDARGHFAGIVELKSPVVAGVGGVAAPATLIPAAAVRTFLQAQGIAPTEGHVAMAQSVVRVICVRK